jgi:hypothetical protein
MSTKALIYCDILTAHRLKRMADEYGTTITQLLHELVESEWRKKKGLERKPKEGKDGTTKPR